MVSRVPFFHCPLVSLHTVLRYIQVNLVQILCKIKLWYFQRYMMMCVVIILASGECTGSLMVWCVTWGVAEVQNAGGGLQQVRTAGRQTAWDGHYGHAVPALLSAHDTVILRLRQATVAADTERNGLHPAQTLTLHVNEHTHTHTQMEEADI